MAARLILPLVLLGVLSSSPALSFVRLGAGTQATLRQLDLVIADSGTTAKYTLSAHVDLRGKNVAVFVPVMGLRPASPKVADSGQALDVLLELTSPRLEEYQPKDPCKNIEDLYEGDPKITKTAQPRPVSPGRSTLTVLDPIAALKIADWAKDHGLKLSPESAEALTKQARQGAYILVQNFSQARAGRGLRLPALSWNAPLQSMDAALGAAQVTLGQPLRVRLILGHTQSALQPEATIVDIGTSVSLPEVAFENPQDLAQAAVNHALRRKPSGTWIRLHVQANVELDAALQSQLGLPDHPIITRFALRVGRKAKPINLTLRPERFTFTFYSRWWFRRVWRKPITCDNSLRYLKIVAVQQRAELMALTALTGRPLVDLNEWSHSRGYALKPDGRLKPVKVKRPK